MTCHLPQSALATTALYCYSYDLAVGEDSLCPFMPLILSMSKPAVYAIYSPAAGCSACVQLCNEAFATLLSNTTDTAELPANAACQSIRAALIASDAGPFPAGLRESP